MSGISQVDTQRAEDNQSEARAQHWGFLASVFAAPPSADLLSAMSQLVGDETALGQAYQRLAKAAHSADTASVEREFFDLFIGVGRGELLPYASFYLTGFLNERPLADLRRDLGIMGIAPAEGRHEPEDHIASLCEIMAGLASGSFSADALGCGAVGEAGFFSRHLQPWAPQFFDDLAVAPSANFYRHVAEVGAMFTDIETHAFGLARKQDGAASIAARS
ncbi:MAG: molecular chaperone TorD family protein [Pseudomonadota bacterium]